MNGLYTNRNIHSDFIENALYRLVANGQNVFIAQEELLSRARGIQFHAYPIQDRGIPTSRKSTTDLVQKLEKVLEAGQSVAVHCRQGIGRSSLIAALLLVSAGVDPEAALAQISQARGCAVPDTLEQRNWIKSFAVAPVSI